MVKSSEEGGRVPSLKYDRQKLHKTIFDRQYSGTHKLIPHLPRGFGIKTKDWIDTIDVLIRAC